MGGAGGGGGFTALGAVEDGADGAFVCYNSGSLATGSGTNFRLQQIDASGTLVLPAAGQQILAAGATPYYAPRMVNTGTALAVLWQSFSGNAPIPVTGAWLDPSGNLTGGPFPVAQCLDMWFWNATTARAVPGGPDGFWVANVFSTGAGLAQVRLQRFDGGAMTPAVTVMGRTLAHAQTYSILQDGSGGVFCITADPAGVVGIERFDVGGRSIWANAHASQFTTIDVSHITMTSATGAALQQVAIGASRLVSIATRWRGGVIAGYEVVPVGIGTRVRFRCFDASGSTVGSESDIGAGAGTQSSTLMIRPRLNLGPATIIPFPPKNPPDPDLVSCIWRTTAAANARIVSTQRLGCCPDVFDVDRVPNPWNYPCAWPVDFPPSIPGVVTVAFPCTRESVGNFGVLPLPQLRGTPGVNIPGGLLSRNVRPPGWVRILFTGVPDDVQIEIQSHDGQRIAKARASATEPRDLNAREVTFKPKAELSYALAFVRPSSDPRDRLTIGISMEFGDGRPGSGEPRRKRKTALRKQSRKRRGRR
jgi:hypothetical protein